MTITFPRHVLKKRRLVHNMDELVDIINKYNGKVDIFLSLYSFSLSYADGQRPQVSYDTSTIDKVLFDFDSDKGFQNVSAMHTHLMNKNIKHRVLFTGRGFHLHILTNSKHLQSKKQALSSYQHKIADEVGLTIGAPKVSDIDNHIIGDIARIARFPNTINIKSGLYCIPLENGFEKLTLREIQELAKTRQHPENSTYGDNLADLTPLDREKIDFYLDIKDSGVASSKITEDFPPCVKHMLTNNGGDAGWKDRYFIIIYLRDMGYSKPDVLAILKKYLTPHAFRHCVYEEQTVEGMFRRMDQYFITKRELQENGCCFNCVDCPIGKMYKKW